MDISCFCICITHSTQLCLYAVISMHMLWEDLKGPNQNLISCMVGLLDCLWHTLMVSGLQANFNSLRWKSDNSINSSTAASATRIHKGQCRLGSINRSRNRLFMSLEYDKESWSLMAVFAAAWPVKCGVRLKAEALWPQHPACRQLWLWTEAVSVSRKGRHRVTRQRLDSVTQAQCQCLVRLR